MRRLSLILALGVLVGACDDDSADAGMAAPPIRGLVTTVVAAGENTIARQYPGVLEPQDITSLSFEVPGKLGEVNLSVGQRVDQGQELARLDSEQFESALQIRQAAVDEARATVAQDRDDLNRQEELFRSGTTTRVALDNARTDLRRSEAQLRQAEQSLASAREDLEKTVIFAPFAGIINSVDADSFATVGAGVPITSLYNPASFEVSFSVNFETLSQLVVGTPGVIRLADDPSVVLDVVVSELGERADTVSSFPVTVAVVGDHPLVRAGMAVEVAFEINLQADRGLLIPITAAIAERGTLENFSRGGTAPVPVFVFDEETSTVRRREVQIAGLRENRFIVVEGLEPGERVASAGVSFLREGMEVRLIEDPRSARGE